MLALFEPGLETVIEGSSERWNGRFPAPFNLSLGSVMAFESVAGFAVFESVAGFSAFEPVAGFAALEPDAAFADSERISALNDSF